MDVGVLGSLEVVVDGQIRELTSPSQRRVLAALVARRGEVVPPDRLAEMTELSLRALRTTISRLRSEIGREIVETRPEGYRLGRVTVDVDRFEQLVGDAPIDDPLEALEALDAALALWRGEPFGEWSDREWAIPLVTGLHELCATAMEDRCESLIALGRFDDVVVSMAPHAAANETRDRPVELLMRALAAQGREIDAHRRFRSHRQRLVDVAGVEPSTRLIDLDARIANGWRDASVRGSVPTTGDRVSVGTIQRQRTSFVGRAAEMAEIKDLLDNERLLTLVGVGGVGKTRLAVQCALEYGEWFDGAVLVELGVIDRDDDVIEAVARALDIRLSSSGRMRSVLEWCRRRRMLFVLDNCEHVLHPAAALAEALTTSTDGVHVLATSRERLRAPGEVVIPVSPLALGETGEEQSDAITLFNDRARKEDLGFDPVVHQSAVAAICRRLDGLPLAVELAAARVRGLSPEEIAARLDQRFSLLTSGRRTANERHATLRAAVEWSYEALDESARGVFDAVAFFVGPFSLDDAVALASSEGDHELAVVDAVGGLVDQSLLVRRDEQPQYRMLETLRAFGREQLTSGDSGDAVAHRLVDLMAEKARRCRNDAAGPGENTAVQTLRSQVADYSNAVHAATQLARHDVAVAIAEDVFLPLALWGDNSEPGAWMHEMLASGATDVQPGSASTCRWLASHWNLFFGGDVERSVGLANEAVELDPESTWAHVMVAFGALSTGRADDAVRAAQSAERHASSAADHVGMFVASGGALLLAGEVDEARTVAERFTEWADRATLPSAMAMASLLEGRVLAEDDPARALEVLQRGLERLEARIPGCWNVATLIKRDMVPLVHQSAHAEDGAGARRLALEVLGECVRHNETGSLSGALAHTSVVLEAGGHDEMAVRCLGAAGSALVGPSSARLVETTRLALRERLGDRYADLLAEGERTSALRIAQDAVDVLAATGR